MFSNWFIGDDSKSYQTCTHKQRIDHIGHRLVELRYAKEVLRQHLHEWLRFSVYLGRL